MEFLNKYSKYLLYLAFAQSLVATMGSLYFSEIMLLPACVLCWYQRIVMYPLTIILATGIIKEDKNVVWYSLPLSIIGAVIAAYHSALQYGWLPESDITCRTGISCTEVQIALFGFITIPLMAFAGFIIISVSLLLYYRNLSPEVSSED